MLPTGRDLSQPHGKLDLRVRSGVGERLDQYLLRRLGWKSRRKVQRLIESGRVVVDGRSAKPALRMHRGDVISVALDPGGHRAADDGLLEPIWEDPYLFAVDKPPGVLVHPVGRTVSGTIINAVHGRYRRLTERGRRSVQPRLCHRLDRETSGVLLVAKTVPARRRLQLAFEENRVAKEYCAIVEGHPQLDRFSIELPICSHIDRERRSHHRLARVAAAGKYSRTDIETLATGPGFSVVLCRPITGRQNQIRAHLAAVGHPIVGDVGYADGDRPWASRAGAPPPPTRALLHSARLMFPHPIWGTRQCLAAPPPSDMTPFLAASS